jgi:hypothetical protein
MPAKKAKSIKPAPRSPLHRLDITGHSFHPYSVQQSMKSQPIDSFQQQTHRINFTGHKIVTEHSVATCHLSSPADSSISSASSYFSAASSRLSSSSSSQDFTSISQGFTSSCQGFTWNSTTTGYNNAKLFLPLSPVENSDIPVTPTPTEKKFSLASILNDIEEGEETAIWTLASLKNSSSYLEPVSHGNICKTEIDTSLLDPVGTTPCSEATHVSSAR